MLSLPAEDLVILSPAFSVIVAFLKTAIQLKSHVKNHSVWVQQMFQTSVWQPVYAKPFWTLLGKRVVTPEDSLMKAITLVINARPHQMRIFQLTKVKYNGVEQELGIMHSLLVDGKSLNWQIAEKGDEDSKLDRNTVLTDLYFAENKRMRMTPSGILTIVMEKEDTISQLDRPTAVEFHLHFKHGPQDFCSLLETRGAIITAVKQSEAHQPANASREESVEKGALSVFSPPGSSSTKLYKPPRRPKPCPVKQKREEIIKEFTPTNGMQAKQRLSHSKVGVQSTEQLKNRRLLLLSKVATIRKASRPMEDVDVNSTTDNANINTVTGSVSKSLPPGPTTATPPPQLATALRVDEENRQPRHTGHSLMKRRESTSSLTPLPSDDPHMAKKAASTGFDNMLPGLNSPNNGAGFSNSRTRKSSRTYSKASKRIHLDDNAQEKTKAKGHTGKDNSSITEAAKGVQSRTGKQVAKPCESPSPSTTVFLAAYPTAGTSVGQAASSPESSNKTASRSITTITGPFLSSPGNFVSQGTETEASQVRTHLQLPNPSKHFENPDRDVGTSESDLRRSKRVNTTLHLAKDRKPKVRADLFYEQPQVAPNAKKKREEVKTTSTTTIPVAEVVARDVRFSSPLERSPANGTASKDPGSRSSLKTRANIDRSPAQPLIQAKVHSESAMETLEIVVHPPSTTASSATNAANEKAISKALATPVTFAKPQSEIAHEPVESKREREHSEVNGKNSGKSSIARLSATNDATFQPAIRDSAPEADALRPTSPLVAEHRTNIRHPRANIDKQLEADLQDSASGNQAVTEFRKTARTKDIKTLAAIGGSNTNTIEGDVPHQSKGAASRNKDQERANIEALGVSGGDELDEVARISVPRLTRKKKRPAVEVSDVEEHLPMKKTKRRHNQVSDGNPLDRGSSENECDTKNANFLREDNGKDLADEEMSMQEMIRKLYKVTWDMTRKTMQVPERECSAAQERLRVLVLEVLQDIFTDTENVIALWQSNQEHCHEVIVNKIIPAWQKIEEEKNEAFGRLRGIYDAWNARRIRVPDEILAWVRD
ncbi:hypothetical protein QFC19_003013 [Naganishia cerealis]|uniref:Uncharacterized protein n=1 Tax=Naganishia cerealis TaxID=610337 RepID=A0ACC2W595_9TREE|nr:hypothetical protein QFC19_003013 [Naganishia cerealis]